MASVAATRTPNGRAHRSNLGRNRSMPQVEKRGLSSMGVNRSTNSEQGKISSWALSVAHPASEISKENYY